MCRGERFNSLTHLAGVVLAIAGTAVLLTATGARDDPWKMVAFSLFGSALVLLYAASTLYHSLRGRAKDIWRKLDHAAIYLLIAGTFAPFMLVSLRNTLGWTLLAAICALAIIGVCHAWRRNDGRDPSAIPDRAASGRIRRGRRLRAPGRTAACRLPTGLRSSPAITSEPTPAAKVVSPITRIHLSTCIKCVCKNAGLRAYQ